MNKPNLFTYATSELSQDAMICWLLSWVSPRQREADLDLHNCGVSLIKSMFRKHSKDFPEQIDEIEISKQDKNIDVLCVVNKKYAIIIEDKVDTKNHSGQLERYLKEIRNRDFCEEDILPIYFKTGDQGNYSEVLDKGYMLFLRSDMLNVLNQYSGNNSILIDYREHLQAISNKVESYKSLPIGEWGWYSWIGFYLRIQEELNSGGWDYVPNQNGGFLGFWWHFQGDENCQQHVQLEEKRLCFKIWVKEPSQRSSLRNKWHNIIREKSFESDYTLKLKKPPRFGNGQYMTVCIHDGDYMQCNSNGIIDISKTIQKLKNAEKLLADVTNSDN